MEKSDDKAPDLDDDSLVFASASDLRPTLRPMFHRSVLTVVEVADR